MAVTKNTRIASYTTSEWRNRKAELVEKHAGQKIVFRLRQGRVDVYAPVEVEGRIQRRATCQCCGGDVALTKGDRTAHHGYTRPGYGWQTESCMGARALPYELGHDQLDLWIEALEAHEAKRVELREKLLAGDVTTLPIRTRQGGKTVFVDITEAEANATPSHQLAIYAYGKTNWQVLIERAIGQVESELRHVRRDLQEQRERRESWAHRPEAIREVEVA